MAGSPTYTVHKGGEYIAACKHVEDAAAVTALNGSGTSIRFRHGTVLWREGQEKQPAGESYDFVAQVVCKREAEMQRAALARVKRHQSRGEQ